MTTIKQAIASADEIKQALLDASNALDEIYAPAPGSPMERVLNGDQRGERITQIMFELGATLRQTGYGHYVAHGLFGTVRVVRGPRAESVWQNQDGAMRWKTVMVGGHAHHVEVEVDIANSCKKPGVTIKQPKDLYDVAKHACHDAGVPWTDPRTGQTHEPPK